ncbi:MAG TPA: DUF2267 domain-containing protein [Gammaproteobacteria bacterium]
MTRVAAFDKTIEKTNVWLNQLQATLSWQDRERAYHALRAVLHAVRDRLHPHEAVDLGAQLPMLIRGFYYDGWHPADKPRKYRDKRRFLEHVAKDAPTIAKADLELVVTAVFGLLSSQLPRGERDQVRRALPASVRELWAQPRL